jgi:peroxiredoxin
MQLQGFALILCMAWGWVSLSARPVTILGSGPGYGGKEIQVRIPGNPFLQYPRYADTVFCDSDGSFEISLELEEGTFVFLETGIYEGSIYAEPGYSYSISLPPYRKKTYADMVSPFFSPVRFHLEVLSCIPADGSGPIGRTEDINSKLYRFDTLFAGINEKVVMNRQLNLQSDVDSVIRTTEASYSGDTSSFFSEYRKYKYGILKMNEGRTGLEEIADNYLGPEVREHHPGFMQLFNAMYRDFLFYFSRTPGGAGIRNAINRSHDLDSLRELIKTHPSVRNDTLADLILLRELYMVFHQGEYHRQAILILLDSMIQDPVIPEYGTYAAQIRQKLSSLLVGSPPPRFSLTDTKGRSYTLSDSKGKYIYLFFCTPEHYGCMMEYPFLQSYHSRHAAYLDVISVMVAEDRETVLQFMERNGYRFRALYYGDQPEILGDYQVRGFPTAYLIGPDGNLVLSPAPPPSEGFEQQLFRIMRSRGDI